MATGQLDVKSEIYVGGRFTEVSPGDVYIAQFKGLAWQGVVDAVSTDRVDFEWTISYDPICYYCGLPWGGGEVCQYCNAPTPRWWTRLDDMITHWRRRCRG